MINVQYVVVDKKGEEQLVTTSKKEADQYDKMLDIGSELENFLESTDIKIDEELREQICLALAKEKDTVMKLLKGKSFDSVTPDADSEK
jgi:dsDNA-binding SOS-regulon protein